METNDNYNSNNPGNYNYSNVGKNIYEGNLVADDNIIDEPNNNLRNKNDYPNNIYDFPIIKTRLIIIAFITSIINSNSFFNFSKKNKKQNCINCTGHSKSKSNSFAAHWFYKAQGNNDINHKIKNACKNGILFCCKIFCRVL